MERPPARPEGALIRLARQAAGLTIPDAVRLSGVSKARWSTVESGYESRGGTTRPVNAKADTIARMAHAVGVTPERMESEGQRPDAAEILREILRSPGQPAPERQRRRLAEVPHEGMTDRLIEHFIRQRPLIDDGGDREVLEAMWASYKAGVQGRDFVVEKIVDFIADDPELPVDWDKPGGGHARHALAGPGPRP